MRQGVAECQPHVLETLDMYLATRIQVGGCITAHAGIAVVAIVLHAANMTFDAPQASMPNTGTHIQCESSTAQEHPQACRAY